MHTLNDTAFRLKTQWDLRFSTLQMRLNVLVSGARVPAAALIETRSGSPVVCRNVSLPKSSADPA
jgi:hypothetical protein